jgi:hypothetical protein
VSAEEQRYRSLIVDFCDVAVNGSAGRMREDPVAQAVTEGHGGSSCGFLLHWAAEMIGIRERWINRNSVSHYRQGENLSLLFGATWGAYGPRCARRVTPGSGLFGFGDFLILEDPKKTNDDHVCICAGDFDGRALLSYDFGQKGSPDRDGKSSQLDGRFCERAMTLEENGKWSTAGGKQIWAYISVPDLVAEARENGKLVDPYEPSEWLRGVTNG